MMVVLRYINVMFLLILISGLVHRFVITVRFKAQHKYFNHLAMHLGNFTKCSIHISYEASANAVLSLVK